MIYLANSFSLQMLKIRRDQELTVYIREVDAEEVKALLSTSTYVSTIGHTGTAEFLKMLLGIEVPVNRQSITLERGDKLIVVQPMGLRLQPGQELTAEDMMRLYREGKVKFILVHLP